MTIAQIRMHLDKDNRFELVCDLLKREDWKDEEWELAKIIEGILVGAINKIAKDELIQQEFIKKFIEEKK